MTRTRLTTAGRNAQLSAALPANCATSACRSVAHNHVPTRSLRLSEISPSESARNVEPFSREFEGAHFGQFVDHCRIWPLTWDIVVILTTRSAPRCRHDAVGRPVQRVARIASTERARRASTDRRHRVLELGRTAVDVDQPRPKYGALMIEFCQVGCVVPSGRRDALRSVGAVPSHEVSLLRSRAHVCLMAIGLYSRSSICGYEGGMSPVGACGHLESLRGGQR